MLPGLTALVLVACSGGSDDEETAPEATSARPVHTATAPSAPNIHCQTGRGAHCDQHASGDRDVGGGGGSDAATGTLEVRVTDAPDPSNTAVYVTTDNIEVSVAGEG